MDRTRALIALDAALFRAGRPGLVSGAAIPATRDFRQTAHAALSASQKISRSEFPHVTALQPVSDLDQPSRADGARL